MPPARLYRRVSDDEQVPGFSLVDQLERCREYCHMMGWPVAGEYADEGISAKDMRRPGLQQLLKDVQPGEVVVTLKVDRLCRSVADLYTLLREWDRYNVMYRSVLEPIDTTNAAGRMILGVLAVLAEWYSDQLGENVKRGMLRMVKQGKRPSGSMPKFGYRWVDGKPVIFEPEADIIHRVEEMYLNGMGIRAIAYETGLTAFSVQKILRDEQYTGVLIYNRTRRKGTRSLMREVSEWQRLEGYFPPLRTPERQAALDAVRAAKAGYGKLSGVPGRAAGSPYILAGLVRCGYCGGAMARVTASHRGGRKQAPIYVCKRYQHAKSCQRNPIRVAQLEDLVLGYMLTLDTQRRLVRKAMVKAQSLPDMSAIDAKFERLLRLHINGKIDGATFDRLSAEIEAERQRAERQLHDANFPDESEVTAQAEKSLADAKRILEGGDTKAIKAYLLARIARIVIKDGGAEIELH